MSKHTCRANPLSLKYHSLDTTEHRIPSEGYTDLFKRSPYRWTFKLFPTFTLINNTAVSIFALRSLPICLILSLQSNPRSRIPCSREMHVQC